MNARERFHNQMHYLPVDRCPIMDFGFWHETLAIWSHDGFPKNADPDRFFGMDPQWVLAPIDVGLCPAFEHIVLEDRGDTEIVRDGEGVTKEQGKFLGSIPKHLGHTLVDRASWEEHYRWRLDGANPKRTPSDWMDRLARLQSPSRDYPLGVNAGSLYGWIRNWMGLEAVSMLVYDDRPLFEEMVRSVADCVIDALRPALEGGLKFDYALMWEDMCYRAGPLLSPKVFRDALVPEYRRITDLLKSHGTDVVLVDCDGDMRALLPHWLEAGVNTMFPIEIGTWGTDPVALRQQFGRRLLMVGGVSKRTLAGSKDDIDAEVSRLAPLVEEGGFIPTPDHRVPPDVPLENYLYYLERARSVWGKGLPNLPPMGERSEASPNPERYAWHLE